MYSQLLSTDGQLSISSAQRIANKCAEYIKDAQYKLQNIRLHNEYISLIGGEKSQTVFSSTILADLPELVTLLRRANILNSVLKEAIKSHETLREKISHMDSLDYSTETGDSMVEDIPVPVFLSLSTSQQEEEWLKTLSIKEVEEYLDLKNSTSIIDNLIACKGVFKKERDTIIAINNGDKVHYNADGADTIITYYEAGASIEKVDEVYNQLRKEADSFKARLNGYLHKKNLFIEAKKTEARNEYTALLEEMKSKRDMFNQRKSQYIADKLAETANLKVVIPNKLADMYELINKL